MKTTWKLLVAVVLGAALAGCKIEVPVPAGGYVTTQSGSFTCYAKQTCVIEANDLNFDETFIAVPDSGMKFVRWEKRDRGFFGGNSNDTVRLFTSGFAGNENLLAILRSNEVFYLQPVFAETQNANEALVRAAPGNLRRYEGVLEAADLTLFPVSRRGRMTIEERVFTSSYTLGTIQLLLSSATLSFEEIKNTAQTHFYQDDRGALYSVVDDDGNYYYRRDLDQYGILDIPSPLVPNTSITFDYEILDGSNPNNVLYLGRKTIAVEPKQMISTPQGTFSAYPIRISDVREENRTYGGGEIQESDQVMWVVPEIGEVGSTLVINTLDGYGNIQYSVEADYRLTGR